MAEAGAGGRGGQGQVRGRVAGQGSLTRRAASSRRRRRRRRLVLEFGLWQVCDSARRGAFGFLSSQTPVEEGGGRGGGGGEETGTDARTRRGRRRRGSGAAGSPAFRHHRGGRASPQLPAAPGAGAADGRRLRGAG